MKMLTRAKPRTGQTVAQYHAMRLAQSQAKPAEGGLKIRQQAPLRAPWSKRLRKARR